MNLLMENTRNPMQMLGDIRALLGTLRAGEERVRALSARYGPAAVNGAARYSLGLAERRMRQALLEVPDGDFTGEATFDDDGITTDPITLRVEIRIRGAEAEIDFSGTDPQSLGPITTGWEEASRAIIGPKIILDPRHPMNAGEMRPFQVLMPPGSMVLGLPPTSQSGHCEMATKIARLMISTMSKAFPPRAVAADSGTTGAIIVFGSDTRPGLEGSPFGGALVFGAAWGGTQVSDGVSFCLSPLFNCRSNIVEFSEKAMPLVVWEYGIVQDSAGAGRFRGGFAAGYTFEALSPTFYTPILDGARFSAEGLDGGDDGATTVGMLIAKDERGGVQSWNGIFPADRMTPMFGCFDESGRPDPAGEFGRGARFMTTKPTAVPMEAGEVMRVHVACPGGYGDPLEREVDRVRLDVANERISLQQAREVYGVVIDGATLEVDEAGTAALRKELAGRAADRVSHYASWPATEDEFKQLTNQPVVGTRATAEV
jgi:N-methylhydantoinase B